MKKRKETRKLQIGAVPVGGGAIVSVQSMTNTDTRNADATIAQIKELWKAGCEIIRVAVPDREAAEKLPVIIAESPIPVIADIHFDHRLALMAIKAGIHGIRINPGNIGDAKKVRAVAEAAGEKNIPIRVGANSGSLPKKIIETMNRKSGDRTEILADALVKSALGECRILEKFGFKNIKVSLKASSVPATVMAYRKFADLADYPLHLGVTEAGTLLRGTVKSSVGIGTLLLEGIGDTIRVSLTADPIEEIKVGIMILESAGLRRAEPEIISCPTCGRTEIDLFGLVGKIEAEIEKIKASGKKIKIGKIAVMGCVVNGPGEAKDADLGIAGSKNGMAAVFKKGKMKGVFPEDEALKIFREELYKSNAI
jgi:(E)-4-hydroxy-3-methylbut-2-enyl-diphosphate synthase